MFGSREKTVERSLAVDSTFIMGTVVGALLSHKKPGSKNSTPRSDVEASPGSDRAAGAMPSVQSSLAMSIIDEHLPGISDAECDALMRKVDSLKLAKLLRQRSELQDRMDSAHSDLRAMQREWTNVQHGIDTMTRRGVQP